MSTKNDKYPFIEQRFTTPKNQYLNLDLNQSKKCPILVPVQSNSKPNNDKYCVSDNFEEKQKLQSWDKSSKASSFITFNEDNDDLKKRWKNENTLKITNKSTLSLHIEAYNNSSEAAASDLKKEKFGSIKTSKQCFTNSLKFRNPFEFPRQQDGDQRNKLEVNTRIKSKENTSHRARKFGGESLDKSGKQTDKKNRRKAEETIKGELEGFIRKLMNAKLTDDKTKTSAVNKQNNTIPELDVKLDENQLKEICLRAREQFMLEPVLLKLQPPICVLGDLHGQFLDLQKMMEKLGPPPKQKYLFLGDYVDRGAFSLETVTMLLAMKVRYPKHLYLLRGNHETRAVNKIYGFFDECKRRFPDDKKNSLWTLFQHVFNCMPMSAIIGEKIFCTHGGISEDLLSWKQFDRIKRPTDVTDLGLLTDLVWADPCNETKRYEISPRGISMVFGPTAIDEFFSNLGIELIVRGHQAVQEGYEFSADKKCLTIFSAPAYCGEQDNLAGILAISKNLECTIYTFKGVGKNPATVPQAGGGGGQEKEVAVVPVANSPTTATAPQPTAQSPGTATTARNDLKGSDKAGAKETSIKERK